MRMIENKPRIIIGLPTVRKGVDGDSGGDEGQVDRLKRSILAWRHSIEAMRVEEFPSVVGSPEMRVGWLGFMQERALAGAERIGKRALLYHLNADLRHHCGEQERTHVEQVR